MFSVLSRCLRTEWDWACPTRYAVHTVLCNSLWVTHIFFLFFKNFCWTHVHFWGHWYPCFRLLVMSPLGFKARVGSLIQTLWRRTWYTFPEIHLWYDTSAGVYGQHSSQSLSPHACFSRGRMPDLNHRPPAWQVDTLTTWPRWPVKWHTFWVMCWILDRSMFWMKQTQMYVCTLVEFILIDVASLLHNVEVIGMEIVYIQSHQYMRKSLDAQLTPWN